jgi:hypothetical protein
LKRTEKMKDTLERRTGEDAGLIQAGHHELGAKLASARQITLNMYTTARDA